MHNRDYTATGAGSSEKVSGFLSINLKDVNITRKKGGKDEAQKDHIGQYAGYVDRIRVEHDQGNPEHNIKPHRKLILSLSASDGEGGIETMLLYIPSYQTKVVMAFLNAIAGAIDAGDWQSYLQFRPYTNRQGKKAIWITYRPDERAPWRWQWDAERKTFGDCPPIVPVPVKDKTYYDDGDAIAWIESKMDEVANDFGRYLPGTTTMQQATQMMAAAGFAPDAVTPPSAPAQPVIPKTEDDDLPF